MAHSCTLSGLRGCLLGSPSTPTMGNLQSVNREQCTGSSGHPGARDPGRVSCLCSPLGKAAAKPTGKPAAMVPPLPPALQAERGAEGLRGLGQTKAQRRTTQSQLRGVPKGRGDGDLGDEVSLLLTTGTPLLACDQLLTPPTCSPQLAVCHGAQVGPQEGPESQVAGCGGKEGRRGAWARPSISHLSRARAPASLSTLSLYSHVRRLPPPHPARLPLLQDQRAWTRAGDAIGSSPEPGHPRLVSARTRPAEEF